MLKSSSQKHRCAFGKIDGPGEWNKTNLNQWNPSVSNQASLKGTPTVDGRNPFRTTWKPLQNIVRWHLQGNRIIPGFLNVGAGFPTNKLVSYGLKVVQDFATIPSVKKWNRPKVTSRPGPPEISPFAGARVRSRACNSSSPSDIRCCAMPGEAPGFGEKERESGKQRETEREGERQREKKRERERSCSSSHYWFSCDLHSQETRQSIEQVSKLEHDCQISITVVNGSRKAPPNWQCTQDKRTQTQLQKQAYTHKRNCKQERTHKYNCMLPTHPPGTPPPGPTHMLYVYMLTPHP